MHSRQNQNQYTSLQLPQPLISSPARGGGLLLSLKEIADLLDRSNLPPEEALRRLDNGGFTFSGQPLRATPPSSSSAFPTGGVVFGREARIVDFALESVAVSRVHAQLTKNQDGYFLEDLNSSNGTFINDERCTPGLQYEVRAYDEIRFGPAGEADLSVTFIFVPAEQHPSTRGNRYLKNWKHWGLAELDNEQLRVQSSNPTKLKNVLEAKLVRYRGELAAEGTLSSTLRAYHQVERGVAVDKAKSRELEDTLYGLLRDARETGDSLELTVGREATPFPGTLALSLPAKLTRVSRNHFTLCYQPSADRWTIRDNSMNGTRVNGRKIGVAESPIMPGSIITLGSDLSLRFMPRCMPPLGSCDTRTFIDGRAEPVHLMGMYARFIAPDEVNEIVATTPGRCLSGLETISFEDLVGTKGHAIAPGAYNLDLEKHERTLPITLHRDMTTGRLAVVTQQQAQRSCVHTCTFMVVADALINSSHLQSADALSMCVHQLFNGTLSSEKEAVSLLNEKILKNTEFTAVLHEVRDYDDKETLRPLLRSGPVIIGGVGEIGAHAFVLDSLDRMGNAQIRDPWHGVKETVSWETLSRIIGGGGLFRPSVVELVQILPRS